MLRRRSRTSHPSGPACRASSGAVVATCVGAALAAYASSGASWRRPTALAGGLGPGCWGRPLQRWLCRRPTRGGLPRQCSDEEPLTFSSSYTDVVTPVGPFCSFKSEECLFGSDLDNQVGVLSEDTPSFAMEMAKIQLDAQMGNEPDTERVRELADKLDKTYKRWASLNQRLSSSGDFQCREYHKLTESHLASKGHSVASVSAVIKYQIDCMRAFADKQLPPMPPPGLDMRNPPGQGSSPMSSVQISAQPFKEEAFQNNPVVAEEYTKLCIDHAKVISLGSMYGDFDPLGKVAFLDQVEKIEERWDIFYARSALMGTLNPEFKEQSAEFLKSMGLNAGQFRKLLRKAHDDMREEAERERGIVT